MYRCQLTDNRQPALVSTAQYARSVREDTAELATYQLADKSDTHSSSFLNRNCSLSFRTTLSSDIDTEDIESRAAAITGGAIRGTKRIFEAAEPAPETQNSGDGTSGEGEPDLYADEGPSLLTRALRRSPPQHVDLFEQENSHRDNGGVFSDEGEEGEEILEDDLSLIAPEGQQLETADDGFGDRTVSGRLPTESTPLLGHPHGTEPNELTGGCPRTGYDIESQKDHRRLGFLRLFDWRFKKTTANGGSDGNRIGQIYRSVTKQKCWDRKVLWENVVVAPIACLPAVIVGLLLNILDALSYGKCTLLAGPLRLALFRVFTVRVSIY